MHVGLASTVSYREEDGIGQEFVLRAKCLVSVDRVRYYNSNFFDTKKNSGLSRCFFDASVIAIRRDGEQLQPDQADLSRTTRQLQEQESVERQQLVLIFRLHLHQSTG